MSDTNSITIKEIALWALTNHQDSLGDHLDLSDTELDRLKENEDGDLLALEPPPNDPRYVDSDDARARLTAYWGEVPVGGWTDDDEPAFRAAVIAQLSDDLIPDGSATLEEIRDGLAIGQA